jgi:hypothetical protein
LTFAKGVLVASAPSVPAIKLPTSLATRMQG